MPSAPSTAELAPPRVACRLAADESELDAHFELRRRVFVTEQQLFAADDRDERDGGAATLHAIGLVGDEICGAVRLYPLEAATGVWKGDRLAVVRRRRALHLGARLVRFAVATAGERGGSRMIAHVQVANVAFFERLGWRAEGAPGRFHGAAHRLMSIGLAPRPGA